MDPDVMALAAAAVEIVKLGVVAGGGPGAAGAMAQAGKDLWGWLKGVFTKPAQAEAVREAEQAPDDALNWEAVKVQLAKALRDDPAFRDELLGRLPTDVRQRFAPQTSTTVGDGNTTVQAQGKDIHIQTDRPGG